MIDLKMLRELVKLMAANELTELDIQDPQGERVTLKRSGNGGYGGPPPPAVVAPPSPPSAAVAAPPASGAPADESAGLVPIASPMVGTFYSASSPDAKAFVSVGGRVGPDSVVCIIEAMKVFNEIKAETTGTVARVLVNSGQAVEFGQPLFLLKPS